MRQTLFRIRLDELWSLKPVDGIAAVGVGYFLIPLGVLAIWCLWSVVRKTGFKSEYKGPAGLWSAITLTILTVPLWRPTEWLPVFGYGFMLFVGFVLASSVAARRFRRNGLNDEIVFDLAIWIFIGGIGGARLFYLIQYHERVFAGAEGLGQHVKAAVNLSDGGLVFYGGVILASVAYFIFCKLRNLDALRIADLLVTSVFIGLAFGRFGCFLNGCCFGDRCDLSWGVAFPSGSVPFRVLAERGFIAADAAATPLLHPTQIYSVINAIVLILLTTAYLKCRHPKGAVVAMALIIYPITRFLIEILRSDEMGKFGTQLTISQLVSLAIVAAGVALAVHCGLRKPDSEDSATLSIAETAQSTA